MGECTCGQLKTWKVASPEAVKEAITKSHGEDYYNRIAGVKAKPGTKGVTVIDGSLEIVDVPDNVMLGEN